MKSLAILSALALATSVAFGQSPTCTFTSFGRPCGGDLAAQQLTSRTGTTVRFDVTNAAPGSIAVLAIGHAARPVALPGSNCSLLLDARATHFSQVDRLGQVSFRFPLPAIVPLIADVQVITVGFDRNGRTAESTNGLHVVCR